MPEDARDQQMAEQTMTDQAAPWAPPPFRKTAPRPAGTRTAAGSPVSRWP
ncbi:hypothetical protein ACFQ4K_19525 [Tistrella bauzanensis]